MWRLNEANIHMKAARECYPEEHCGTRSNFYLKSKCGFWTENKPFVKGGATKDDTDIPSTMLNRPNVSTEKTWSVRCRSGAEK